MTPMYRSFFGRWVVLAIGAGLSGNCGPAGMREPNAGPRFQMYAEPRVDADGDVTLSCRLVNTGRVPTQIRAMDLPWYNASQGSFIVARDGSLVTSEGIRPVQAFVNPSDFVFALGPGDMLDGRLFLFDLPAGHYDLVGMVPCRLGTERKIAVPLDALSFDVPGRNGSRATEP